MGIAQLETVPPPQKGNRRNPLVLRQSVIKFRRALIHSERRLRKFNHVARKESSPTSGTQSRAHFGGNLQVWPPPIIGEAKSSPIGTLSNSKEFFHTMTMTVPHMWTSLIRSRSNYPFELKRPMRGYYIGIHYPLLLHPLISVSFLCICVFATLFYQKGSRCKSCCS